jgi:hypothetical protein
MRSFRSPSVTSNVTGFIVLYVFAFAAGAVQRREDNPVYVLRQRLRFRLGDHAAGEGKELLLENQ